MPRRRRRRHEARDFDSIDDALARAYADGYRFIHETATKDTVYKPIDDGKYLRMTLYSEKGRWHWPYGGRHVVTVKSMPGKTRRLTDILDAKENPARRRSRSKKKFWEDLPPAEQDRLKALRRQELETIDAMVFPVEGTFLGESVTVLGPVHRFPPYDVSTWKPTLNNNNWLMLRYPDGRKVIAHAQEVHVGTKTLVTPAPPCRDVVAFGRKIKQRVFKEDEADLFGWNGSPYAQENPADEARRGPTCGPDVQKAGWVHRGGCHPARPLCRIARREKGLCHCEAYPHPHRMGGGLCVYGPEGSTRFERLVHGPERELEPEPEPEPIPEDESFGSWVRRNPVGRGIKRGDPVEFTREYKQHYTMGDGEFGIAIENERPNRSVMVELADGSQYLAKYIHAYAWGGWMPEELEPVWEKYNPEFEENPARRRARGVDRLDDWYTTKDYGDPFEAPELKAPLVVGVRSSDGEKIITSQIVKAVGTRITTKTGSVYELGRPERGFLEHLRKIGHRFDPRQPIKLHTSRLNGGRENPARENQYEDMRRAASFWADAQGWEYFEKGAGPIPVSGAPGLPQGLWQFYVVKRKNAKPVLVRVSHDELVRGVHENPAGEYVIGEGLPPAAREASKFHVGQKVLFGRPRGEKTLGEIVRINPSTITIKQIEDRGSQRLPMSGALRNYPVGTIWRVHPKFVQAAPKGAKPEKVELPRRGARRVPRGTVHRPDDEIMAAIEEIYDYAPESEMELWTKRDKQRYESNRRAKLQALFHEMGRQVTPDEVWQWRKEKEESRRAAPADRPPPDVGFPRKAIEVWKTADGSWTWEIYEKEGPGRWFARVFSPFVGRDGEWGYVDEEELRGVAHKVLMNPADENGIPWVKTERDPKLHEELIEIQHEKGPIKNARDVYNLLEPWASKQDKEHLCAVLLDIHSELRGVAIIHIGQRDRVAVDPADVLKPAIDRGAKGLVLIHNHPSGSAEHSKADAELTKAVRDACKTVDIEFVDHVVLGMGQYYSFGDKKLTKVKR